MALDQEQNIMWFAVDSAKLKPMPKNIVICCDGTGLLTIPVGVQEVLVSAKAAGSAGNVTA